MKLNETPACNIMLHNQNKSLSKNKNDTCKSWFMPSKSVTDAHKSSIMPLKWVTVNEMLMEIFV